MNVMTYKNGLSVYDLVTKGNCWLLAICLSKVAIEIIDNQ